MAFYVPHTQIKKTGFFIFSVWSFFSALAALQAFGPMCIPTVKLSYIGPRIQFSAAMTYVLFLSVPFVVLNMSEKWEKIAVRSLIAFFIIDAILIALKAFGHRGLLDVGTFDVAVMALLLPFIGSHKYVRTNRAFGLLALFFVIMVFAFDQTGATSKLIFAAIILGWTLSKRMWKTVGLQVAAIGAAFYFIDDFQRTAGRFTVYENYYEIWKNSGLYRQLAGMGFGSITEIAMQKKLVAYPKTVDSFPLLIHNDYLQLLYEGGALALAIFLAFLGRTLYRLRNKPDVFGAACGFLFFMVTYFPTHYLPSIFLGALIVKESLED